MGLLLHSFPLLTTHTHVPKVFNYRKLSLSPIAVVGSTISSRTTVLQSSASNIDPNNNRTSFTTLESFNVPTQKSYFLPGLSSVHTFQPESSKIQLEIATNHAHHGRNFYASALLCSRPQSLAIRMNALMLWRTTDPFLAAGELKSLRLRASFSAVVVVDFRIFNPLFPPKFSSDFEPFHQKHQLGIAV